MEKTATIEVKGEPGIECDKAMHTIQPPELPGYTICPFERKLKCPGFLVRNPDGTGCPAKAKE